METELAIESSREAIKVCLMVGGPILGVCLIVGLLMGLAQAMSHIQDQALATVPKILAILAVVGFALPWFAERMMEFSKDQFSKPMMAANPSGFDGSYDQGEVRSLLDFKSEEDSYYPQAEGAELRANPVSFSKASFSKDSFLKERITKPQGEAAPEPQSPFSLPSYRFSRRPSENIEG